MAATTDLDTAGAVLAAAREDKDTADAAEVRMFQRAVDWAALHSVDSIGPAAAWEGELPIAGDGAPLVAEFCVAEFALAIGKSTDAGRAYLGEAVEVRYRLPKTWALVVAGKLPVWKARQIAKATLSLPFQGAGFVDTHVAPVAAKLSFAQLERVVEEARVRFDPVEAEARRQAAADGRCFDVDTHQVSFDGTVDVRG
ncbi:MAG: endonuclease, partial [Nocardioides sp.]|nr:endonuclease [Nocardioides sp.]